MRLVSLVSRASRSLGQLARQARRDQRGGISFEWILLITVVVIGAVGGLSAVRDGVISELGDVAGGVVAVDQSFSIAPDPFFHRGGFQFNDTQCNTASTARAGSAPAYATQGGGSGN